MTRMRTAWASARSPALWLVGAAALFVFTWPLAARVPTAGLDNSWVAGLGMALRDHLDYGREVIFTYGPWGFVEHLALYDTEAYRLALGYHLVLRGAEALLVWIAVSRTWGRGWGFLVAALTLWATFLVEPRAVVSLVIAILIVTSAPRSLAWWIPAVLGLWSGFELLGKASTGAQVLLVLAAALALGPQPRRWRTLGIFAAGAAGGLLVSWLALGQALGAIPVFVRGSLEIIVGYTPAMSLDDPALRWEYFAALGLAVAAGLGVRAATAQRIERGGTGLAVVSALFFFFTFKEGFVRHDAGHDILFFAAVIALLAVLPWGAAHRAQALLALMLGVFVFLGLGNTDLAALVNPRDSLRNLRQDLRLAYRAGERNALVEQSRATMIAGYGLKPATLAALQGHTVHVLPWEIGVAWAYRLQWRPLPVFQDYSVYTSWLDATNAGRLGASDGPERILQAPPEAIDGRLPAWEPPQQNVTLLCRGRRIAAQAAWRVLAIGADRCGPPRRLSTVHTTWGGPVAVPAVGPRQLLTMRVSGVDPSGLERLRALVWQPAPRYAELDGHPYRLITATAGDGLLLRAPASIDPPGPFHLAPAPSVLRFLRAHQTGPQSGGDITVEFDVRDVR